MKQIKKIYLSLVLSITLMISSVLPVYAATDTKTSSRVQVIYEVKYIDQETNESLNVYKTRKIGFSGEEETEKAEKFAGYTLVSESEVSIILDENEDNEVVFYYLKSELLPDPLAEAKSDIVEKINQFDNIKDNDKEDLLARIESAETQEDLDEIYRDAETLAASSKVQVIYEVKYLDQTTNESLNVYKTRKISFAGEEETEKAEEFAGYTLVSESEVTITLHKNEENEVVFYYLKNELLPDSLAETKSDITEKINRFDSIKAEDKKDLLARIESAETQEDLEKIYQDAEKLNLVAEKEKALKNLENLIFIPEDKKKEIIGEIEKAGTQDEINEIVKAAEELNEKSVKRVEYNVKHIDMVTGDVLESFTKNDFQFAIVEEEALAFEGYGLVSPAKQGIILNPDKDNTIVFNYKEFDDDTIPLKEFLQKKLDYKYPLVYRDTDFTGDPDGLREYLIRKIHNGDLYAKFTATKEDQEKAYWDLFNKPSYAGNMRFARNWTDPKDTQDRNTPVEFTIGFTYADTKEDMREAEDKMYSFVQKNINDGMSDLEKVHIIHDFILNKGKAAITEDGVSLRQLESGRPSNSSVAFMLEGQAVCEGYAMAFNRMAELAGVETIYVTGIYTPEWYFDAYKIKPDTYNKRYEAIVNTPVFDKRLNHAWNLVNLDGKWYNIDTYHDDFFSISNPGMKQEYVRFLKSDQYFIQKAGRYWNFAYTPKAEEDYYGSFDFITDFVE